MEADECNASLNRNTVNPSEYPVTLGPIIVSASSSPTASTLTRPTSNAPLIIVDMKFLYLALSLVALVIFEEVIKVDMFISI
jgi:hypothetical protein